MKNKNLYNEVGNAKMAEPIPSKVVESNLKQWMKKYHVKDIASVFGVLTGCVATTLVVSGLFIGGMILTGHYLTDPTMDVCPIASYQMRMGNRQAAIEHQTRDLEKAGILVSDISIDKVSDKEYVPMIITEEKDSEGNVIAIHYELPSGAEPTVVNGQPMGVITLENMPEIYEMSYTELDEDGPKLTLK